MRLFIILICYFGFVFGAFAQNQRSYYEAPPYHYTVHYPDHNSSFYIQPTAEVLKYTDPDKTYYWYSGNQVNITQGGFSGKLLHGKYGDYYLNKNLKEQGVFKMGLKHGEWKSWTAEGKLISILNFADGILQGAFQNYGESGKLANSGFYKQSKLNGKYQKYATDGKIETLRYKNGIVQNPKPNKILIWFNNLFKKHH